MKNSATLAGWALQEKQKMPFVICVLTEDAYMGTAGMPTMNFIKSPKVVRPKPDQLKWVLRLCVVMQGELCVCNFIATKHGRYDHSCMWKLLGE